MKRSRSFQIIGSFGALALTVVSAGCSMGGLPATSSTAAVVSSPGSEVGQTLERLREAERADRMNSESYTDNSTLGHYYARKADEVDAVIVRIQKGESVPADDVNEALNNDEATQY